MTKSLKEVAFEKFGAYPIVVVNEKMICYKADPDIQDDETVYSHNTFHIDIEKITDDYDIALTYVKHILVDAFDGVETISTSKKYSFSDTPRWWETMTNENLEGRLVLTIAVNEWEDD